MFEESRYIRALECMITGYEKEVKELKQELEVYHDMQENLNTALCLNPELLDYIEVLQSGGDRGELLDIALTYDSAFYGLIKHNGHLMEAMQKLEEMNEYLDREVGILNLRNRNQRLMLEAYEEETARLELVAEECNAINRISGDGSKVVQRN